MLIKAKEIEECLMLLNSCGSSINPPNYTIIQEVIILIILFY